MDSEEDDDFIVEEDVLDDDLDEFEELTEDD